MTAAQKKRKEIFAEFEEDEKKQREDEERLEQYAKLYGLKEEAYNPGKHGGIAMVKVAWQPCYRWGIATNDHLVEEPAEGEEVTWDHMTNALNIIKFPKCTSRPNVTPDSAAVNAKGEKFIDAFALGLVKPRFTGLCASRTCKIRPKIARLANRFFKQEKPDFRFTTVQFNKDYATKLHVDGNNQ